MWLVGSSHYEHTDQFGRAKLRGVAGSTYTVACGMPRGFASVSNQTVTVPLSGTAEVAFSTTLTPIISPPLPDVSDELIPAYVLITHMSGFALRRCEGRCLQRRHHRLDCRRCYCGLFPATDSKDSEWGCQFLAEKGHSLSMSYRHQR